MATNKPETPEAMAFRNHFAELAKAIQDPVGLAMELYAGGIITPELLSSTNETQSKQASKVKLLQAVGDQISLTPGKFDMFLSILKRDASLQITADNMRSTYYGADFELSTAPHPGQASQSTPHNASSSIIPRQDDSLTSDKPPKHSKPTPKLDASAVKLSWKRCHPMPETMRNGCIAVSANKVYVNRAASNLIYEYDSDNNKWCNVIKCKKIQFGMAVVNELLTIIGGYDLDEIGKYDPDANEGNRTTISDTLLSLVDSQSPAGSKQWSEHFKPMPTKRKRPMVCCFKKHLLVAGGNSAKYTSQTSQAVEIMNVETGEWKVATSLPAQSGFSDSLANIGERIYILFANPGIKSCCSVVTTTLEALIQSTSPESWSIVTPIVWQKLPEALRLYMPRLVTLAGNLLAIGGQPTTVFDNLEGKYVDDCNPAAYIYDTEESAWRMVGYLPSDESDYPKSFFIVSSLSRDRVIVIGGGQYGSSHGSSDMVHIGFLA